MSERRRFDIADVTGGMNPDRDPLNIEDNEAADLLNFRIDRVGNLVGRQGRKDYGGDEAPDSTNILALGRWVGVNRISDYVALVALDDGTIRTVDDDTGYSVALKSGLSTTAQGMFLEVEDLVIYANGEDDMVAFDGTNVHDLHIAAPSGTSTQMTTGTLSGDYSYAVAYVSTSRGLESPAEVVGPVTPSNEGVMITIPASGHAWVDKVNIYRTTNGGATLMFLAQVDVAAPAIYTDDGSADLSPLVTPVTDAIIPGDDVGKKAENIAYHQGRLWASVGDELYWSRPFQLGLFPYYTNTVVPFAGNDKITALKAFQDYLVVFGEMNTVLVAGDGGVEGLDIQLVRQDTDIGATSRDAMVEVDNQLVFLSARGMYVFPGFGEFATKLSRSICDATAGCRSDASMVYVPTERSVWLSITNQTWVIHLPNQGLSRYDFYMRKPLSGGANKVGLPIWINAVHARTPMDGAHMLVAYAGLDDFGDPIGFSYNSKVFHLGDPGYMKYWRRIGLFATSGGGVYATVRAPDTSRSHSFVLQAEDSGETSYWDGGLWDDALWTNEGVGYYISALPMHKLYGRSMQLQLQANSADGITIHTPIGFTYRASDRFLGR